MSRNPVLVGTLWVLRVARLALLLAFVAYFVSVQINAAAYLAGRTHPIVGGTVPPAPLDSDGAAVADIIGGLVFEAIAALIFFIVGAMFWGAVRKR